MFKHYFTNMDGIHIMNNNYTEFDINAFEALPDNLKNNDYIDLLLFLLSLKPNVRLGKNSEAAYNNMKKWCNKFHFKFIISSSGYMYISKRLPLAKLTQFVDDALWEHSEILGLLLGYPKCCRKKIKLIGEENIDKYEKKLCDKGFSKPFHIINCSSYTKGYALISHVPCCNRCRESLIIAKKALSVIRKYKAYPCMKRWSMYF